MDDFEDRHSDISWLPCDRRHYFHKDCIMFWLVKHETCPLCTKIVDFAVAQKQKIKSKREQEEMMAESDHNLLKSTIRSLDIWNYI